MRAVRGRGGGRQGARGRRHQRHAARHARRRHRSPLRQPLVRQNRTGTILHQQALIERPIIKLSNPIQLSNCYLVIAFNYDLKLHLHLLHLPTPTPSLC